MSRNGVIFEHLRNLHYNIISDKMILRIIQCHPRTLNEYNVDLLSLQSPCPHYFTARGAIENIYSGKNVTYFILVYKK